MNGHEKALPGDSQLSQISATAPAAQRKQGEPSVGDSGRHRRPVEAEGVHPSKGEALPVFETGNVCARQALDNCSKGEVPRSPAFDFGRGEEPDAEPEDAIFASRRVCKFYPLVLSAAQMERMERAVSLAIQDAVEALEEEPLYAHEIQPDLDAFNQLWLNLQAAKTAYGKGKAVANEGWRQAMQGLAS